MTDTKLREWAREHGFVNVIYGPNGGLLTCENKIVEAGESLIRQCAETLVELSKQLQFDSHEEEVLLKGAEAILRYYGIGEGK